MANRGKQAFLEPTYTWDIYDGQSPTRIDYVARLKGIAPPSRTESFDYCELGCGNGLTANAMAACFPEGRFIAVDINPDHVANAKRYAAAGGLHNVDFIEDSFDGLLHRDLPRFDYITLHGVYSWISPAVRRDVVKLIDKFLKPGGLVYVGYNALPGWATLLPIRQMMLDYTSHLGPPSRERVVEGLKILKHLRDNKAAYFEENPGVADFLDEMLDDDPSYIIHEFFNESWQPQYFSEVAAEMAAAGLEYCGSTDAEMNYLDVNVPQKFHSILRAAENTLRRQACMSLIVNEMFRRDVYCKAPALLERSDRPRLFADQVFAAVDKDGGVDRGVELGEHKVKFTGPPFDDLLAAASAGALTVAEARALPAMRRHSEADIVDALNKLVAAGQFEPRAARSLGSEGDEFSRIRIVSRFNRFLLEERLFQDSGAYVASPVLGRAIPVPFMSGLLLLASDGATPNDVIDNAISLMNRSGKAWRRDGRLVTNPKKGHKLLERDLNQFRKMLVPYLMRTGIVEHVRH